MANPTSRAEFKDYCLRKLGAPVIEINVADAQVEDRIDEALQYWQDYHFDGSQHIYLKHQLTERDVENGYVTVPEDLVGVTRIFDLSSSIGTGSGMFNAQYQFVLNNIAEITSFKLTNYYMTMEHLSFIQDMLVGKPQIRYNRHINKVFIDVSKSKTPVGSYVIIEAYKPIDGDFYENMWSDRWLLNYATVLIKEQWGSNLTKFVGMQMPGGVTFNGEQILNDAKEEKRKMEEEMINSFSIPVFNFIG